uniref:BHLH domain-containing protein n=1 Tax=Ciona savignyi TaxID=51511 RepID=H2YEP3_CIOSA
MVKGPKTVTVLPQRHTPFPRFGDGKVRKVIQSENEELKELYQKLGGMLPSCKNKMNTSSIDIVLSAVDYIRELHSLLDQRNIRTAEAVTDVVKRNSLNRASTNSSFHS